MLLLCNIHSLTVRHVWDDQACLLAFRQSARLLHQELFDVSLKVSTDSSDYDQFIADLAPVVVSSSAR